MITPMSVNNSIVNAGLLSQMELLGKRLATVATKFQCVVRWYVRILIKLCSNFYSLFEMSQGNFVKSRCILNMDRCFFFVLFIRLFFSFFLSFFWKICVCSAQGAPPWTPIFSFPLHCFLFFTLHCFLLISFLFFPFLLVAVH